MRGSDEEMELIITRVIKSLAEEVGFSLNNIALSRRCPSHCTLARGNKRLVVDVFVSVVLNLQRDNVKDIVFMLGYGKRSGIEHFVKNYCLGWLEQRREESSQKLLCKASIVLISYSRCCRSVVTPHCPQRRKFAPGASDHSVCVVVRTAVSPT
jgi:hypothetical protein